VLRENEIDRLAQTLWHFHHLNLPIEKADCIIGLGSYDLRVAERCADLYKNNWAPLIIFSGRVGNWTTGLWEHSEAEMFARHAIAKGVPEGKIKLEDQSTNIGENIRLSKELLAIEAINPQSVTIVTKPSTERRVFATCRLLWPEMKIYITSPQIDFREQRENGSQDRLIDEMVGDIQRMKVYPTLGFQIPQDIPDDVWRAYETLVSLGHDKHLIRY
jgi:uncharacterized SAM-binding protein YcdF (DUF218 family)